MYVNACLVGLFYDLNFFLGGGVMGAIVGFLYTSIYFGLFVIVFFFNLGAGCCVILSRFRSR